MTSSFENIWPFCQPKTHENLKAKAAFRRKRCPPRMGAYRFKQT